MKPSYCTNETAPSCAECSFSSYGRDCHNERILLSILEVAAIWGVSRQRVSQLCREGRIPGASMVGRTYVIPAAGLPDLDNIVDTGSRKKGEGL